MDLSQLTALVIMWLNFLLTKGSTPPPGCPEKCDLTKCPMSPTCNGQVVKDPCGCCPVKCSYWMQQYPMTKKEGACKQVTCPKFKACTENAQGLPLCTCPNILICRRRRRQVCASDGTEFRTFKSRCHMRVTECTLGKRLKVKHKGACVTNSYMVSTQRYGGNVKYPDSEYDIAKKRKKIRRKERRKNKKLRRRKRRYRKRYNYLRQRRPKTRYFRKNRLNRLNSKFKKSKKFQKT